MANEVLVGDQLSQEMIDAGVSLIRALDSFKSKLTVAAAFWLLFPEAGAWRLVVAAREVSKDGPKAAYSRIRMATRLVPPDDFVVATKDIAVAELKAPLVQLLASAIHTGPGIAGVRFTRNTINGQYIPDAYIYRLHLRPNGAG